MASDADISFTGRDVAAQDGASPASLFGESPPVIASKTALSSIQNNDDGSNIVSASDAVGLSEAEIYYNSNQCSLKVLVVMCHGICVDDELLLDTEKKPWSSIPILQIRPNREQYAKEVIRRWAHLNPGSSDAKIGPRPKAWNLPVILEWLVDHQIVSPLDIAFLKKAVNARKNIAESAGKEEEEQNARLGTGNWNSTACMRLIHTLIDNDSIKSTFLNRMNLPAGRSNVENRQQARANDVWHQMSDKWNHKSFSPETVAMPEVHTEFTFSDVILHTEVAHLAPATAEKVEDKWSSMIFCCIANWQKIGRVKVGLTMPLMP